MNDPAPQQLDDTTIAVLIMDRDEEGLRSLLEAHGPAIKGALRKTYRDVLAPDEIEEVLNQAAFHAWRKISQFDDTRGTLGAWFLAIARNAAIDYLRQADRQRLDLVEDPSEHVDPWSVAEDFSDNPELQKLTEALNDIIDHVLSPQQREVVLADMAANGQADNERLADRLETSVAAVHTARSKAHRRISGELARRGLAPARKE